MLALPELQNALRLALLQDDEAALNALEPHIEGGALPPRERLGVYRNNVVASLTEVLRETFPVVCRVVGEQFFTFAAREFIAAHPPARPSLVEYGEAFPCFLATFPPCRDLPYLRDTAQLEWLMNVAAHAAETAAISPACLVGTPPDEAVRLTFEFHPSYAYLASPIPVDRIWRANQADAQDHSVDLDTGGVRLEVSRRHDSVVFRALDEAEFAFRRSLSEGAALGAALETALAVRTDFAAADALAALFHDGAVVAARPSSSAEEHVP